MQKVPKLEPQWVSSEAFKEKLITLMFKEIGMKKESVQVYVQGLDDYSHLMKALISKNYFQPSRQTNIMAHNIFLGLELYQLADVLTDVYKKDPELGCLMTALAWVESGFHNRRGSSGERGYYQVLPSTIKDAYKKNYQDALFLMEADPKFATDFAIWYLGCLRKGCSLNTALYHYNGHPSYPALVQYRLNHIRRLMK
jgi:hypothetical protein